MSLFNFNLAELLTFFAVLMRFSILISVIPILGDRVVPVPLKILFSVSVSIALFPALVRSNLVVPNHAWVWGASAGGLISTIALEVLLGLLLGYVGRLVFDAIHFGANLVGNFMGFASASTYDPHQESQTDIIAKVQVTLAMLLFLALDGHHLLLSATLNSYKWVGLGRFQMTAETSKRLIEMTAEVFQLGFQIAAPVAISVFSIHTVFGILSKAMPQLNIFILSFAVVALVGFLVLFLSLDEFHEFSKVLFEKLFEWLTVMMRVSSGGK